MVLAARPPRLKTNDTPFDLSLCSARDIIRVYVFRNPDVHMYDMHVWHQGAFGAVNFYH